MLCLALPCFALLLCCVFFCFVENAFVLLMVDDVFVTEIEGYADGG